jgi:4'-phosphopantetheinyl transferase
VRVTAGATGRDGWGALTVCTAGDPPMTGWWRREGAFLLTVATGRPAPPPVTLDPPGALTTAVPRHSWLDRPSPG